ncbi:MAG: S-adenosylmethionine:tRNA ribosyltransferase-isomerase [Actinophytocola sp.]|nr:S-adenosylmethionine:tRNA ribosyltransferase-isomerase [Actinophytocola sp.]
MTTTHTAPVTRFTLPADAEARTPAEHRGLDRDAVRLLVARPGGTEHRRFHDLPEQLAPGDLVVLNTSATLPAALVGRRGDGSAVPVHVSTQLDDGDWVVELRKTDASGPDLDGVPGERLRLPGGRELRLIWPYPDPDALISRLWRAQVTPEADPVAYLTRHGSPIGYGYVAGSYPLTDYQTVYASEPGSAEMASAGRPFTSDLLVRLLAKGVTVAPVVLHAGVSSAELQEPPAPERFAVPAATARLVNGTREAGGRVVAVGTTVVRALETAAAADGTVTAAQGWTDLVLGPERPARVISGLITGLHAPEASHLLLLEAVAGADLVGDAYAAALREHYLWHEFGDSMLLLPE